MVYWRKGREVNRQAFLSAHTMLLSPYLTSAGLAQLRELQALQKAP